MPIEYNPKIPGGFNPGDLECLIRKVATKNMVPCPHCRTVNIFQDGVQSKECQECGKVYVREVRKDA